MILAVLLSAQKSHIKQLPYELLKPGTYVVQTDENLQKPAIDIVGDNKVLDYKGVTLRGSNPNVEPDQRKGLGIHVSGKNITIKNLHVHGYKVALLADHCTNLKIENCDFSYNWKQHLMSTLEKEDESDWMSYHQNEKDEWLRYGAGIYLKDVNGFEVKGTTIVGGQCGLMMMRSNKGTIWNNNFSFLSGIGVGMYRSSENRIMHNSIDWCVRGYSHGVYNRGQDSAGILIYEQSNKNTFAYNSVTHGGDGFFLWAGQTTMDTGKGGCNDNFVYGNDFSYAPTNGIESTFSRNRFTNNKVDECWHGFWTGYSFDTIIEGNHISNCEEGIAHEHGQMNVIQDNSFSGNKTDIHIWANPNEDPNWGYPKNRDTKSKIWNILNNSFASGLGAKALRVSQTDGVNLSGNTVFGSTFEFAKDVTRIAFTSTCIHGNKDKILLPNSADVQTTMWEPMPADITVPKWDPINTAFKVAPKPLPGGRMPLIPLTNGVRLTNAHAGRKNILVDEWGPYDFQSPKLWPTSYYKDGSIRYDILGPNGRWTLKSADGFTTTMTSGSVPGLIVIKPVRGTTIQKLELAYVGQAFVDYKGNGHKAGEPSPLMIQRFDIPIDWRVKFFEFDPKTEDPRTQFEAYQKKANAPSALEFQKSKLDYTGYGKFEKGVPANHFGTVAEGELNIKPGEYTLELTGDDGVRAWLDGKLIIDEWHYQGPTLYKVKAKLGGKHKLLINHFQLDGYSALQFRIRPAK